MIAIIIGTKAELIKCVPIMLELQKRKQEYYFIHTGQHPLGKACAEFSVKKPNIILSEEPKISTKFWSKINKMSILWFLSMIFKVKRAVRRLKIDYVIYHGDTMSTAAAAIGSSRLLNPFKKYRNVHLEAGLRSGSVFEPFPEEISRRIADFFSDILLAVSERSKNNLKRYEKRKKIIKVGNTVIDSSLITYEKAKKAYKKRPYDYALINVHRHENLKSKERMRAIVEILKAVKIKALWPLHDNTKFYLERYGLMKEVKKMKNIEIMPLINYFNFIFLIANCKYLVTDGGSIQEESLVFRKPCIILRKLTERQEGLASGINFLTKLDVAYSKDMIKKIEDDKIRTGSFKNPYGEPGVSKKIVDLL